MTYVQSLLILETALLIAMLGTKLYKAKKNDGKITADEVIGILTESQTVISEIVSATLPDISGKEEEIKLKISSNIKEYIKNNDSISDSVKTLILDNIDKYIDIVYEKISDVVYEKITKK